MHIAASSGQGLKSESETQYAPDFFYTADRPWNKAEKREREKETKCNEASNYQGVLARCDLPPFSLSLSHSPEGAIP